MKKKLLVILACVMAFSLVLGMTAMASAENVNEGNTVAEATDIGKTPAEWSVQGSSAAEISNDAVTLKSNGNWGAGFMALTTPLNSSYSEIAFEFVNSEGENRLGDNWLLLNLYTNTNVFNGWATLMDGSLSTDAIGVTMLIRSLHNGEDKNHGLRVGMNMKSYDDNGNLVHTVALPDSDQGAINSDINLGGPLKLIFKQDENGGFVIQFTDGTEEGTLTIDSATVPQFANYKLADKIGGSYFYMCTEAGWQTGTMKINNIYSAPMWNDLNRYESKGDLQVKGEGIYMYADTKYNTAVKYEGYINTEFKDSITLWDNGVAGVKVSHQLSFSDAPAYPRDINGESVHGVVFTFRYDFGKLVVEAAVNGTNINTTYRQITASAPGDITFELKTNDDSVVEAYVNNELINISTIAGLKQNAFCTSNGLTYIGHGFTSTDDAANHTAIETDTERVSVIYYGYSTDRANEGSQIFITLTGMPVYALIGSAATMPEPSVFHYGKLETETVLTVKDPNGNEVAVENYAFTPELPGRYTLTYTVTDTEGASEVYETSIDAISTEDSLKDEYLQNKKYWNDPFNAISNSAGKLYNTAHSNYQLPISFANESISVGVTVVGLGNVGSTATEADVECWVSVGLINTPAIHGPDTSYGANGIYFLMRNIDGFLKLEAITVRDNYGVFTSEQIATDLSVASGSQLVFTVQKDGKGNAQILINGTPYGSAVMAKVAEEWDFAGFVRQVSDKNGNMYLTYEAYDEDTADEKNTNVNLRCLSFSFISTQPVESSIDETAPEISVNFTQTEAKVGDEITVAAAMVEDDVDGVIDYTVKVLAPDGSEVAVEARKFTVTVAGVYKLIYSAADNSGNPAEKVFEITVTENGQSGSDAESGMSSSEPEAIDCNCSSSVGGTMMFALLLTAGAAFALRKKEN